MWRVPMELWSSWDQVRNKMAVHAVEIVELAAMASSTTTTTAA
jgi:hypothetical protein